MAPPPLDAGAAGAAGAASSRFRDGLDALAPGDAAAAEPLLRRAVAAGEAPGLAELNLGMAII